MSEDCVTTTSNDCCNHRPKIGSFMAQAREEELLVIKQVVCADFAKRMWKPLIMCYCCARWVGPFGVRLWDGGDCIGWFQIVFSTYILGGLVSNLMDGWAKLWTAVPNTIIWVLWKTRNEIVVKDIKPNWVQIVELVKVKLAIWVRYSCRELKVSVHDLMRNLKMLRFGSNCNLHTA